MPDLELDHPLVIVEGHMGGLYAEPEEQDIIGQRDRIETICEQCFDSDMAVGTVYTWEQFCDLLADEASNGVSADYLTEYAQELAAHHFPQATADMSDALRARLEERERRWLESTEEENE